jgi:uncharacterized protein YciI
MLWAVHCLDKPDTEAERNRLRAIHRQYLDKYMPHLFFSGPLLEDDEPEVQLGSLFILDLPSRAEAEAYIANEPFNLAGVFERVTIWRMRGGRFNPHLSGMDPAAIGKPA